MSAAHQFIVNVEVAVLRGAEILLIRRADDEEHAAGQFSLPGGKLEPADTEAPDPIVAAGVREVSEETGLEVADPRYVYSGVFLLSDGRPVLNVVLATGVSSGKLTLDPAEASEVAWYPIENALALDLPPWTRRAVLESVRLLDNLGPGGAAGPGGAVAGAAG